MAKISVILAARNAEKTLDCCLISVRNLHPEIIFVDDHSTDRTAEIARKYGVKFFQQKLESFGAQKQFALDQASGEWVFLIDSDECAGPDLVKEILETVSHGGTFSAYQVARRNFYFGQWLRFGGKYPDHQVRLFKKGKVRFSGDIVHERLIVDGQIGTLKGWIEHDSYPDLGTWFRKLEMFSDFRAKELSQKGVAPSPWNAFRFCFFRPGWRFIRKYFLKFGFLDGVPGLLACIHDALTEILTYFHLVQNQNFDDHPPL